MVDHGTNCVLGGVEDHHRGRRMGGMKLSVSGLNYGVDVRLG